MSSRWHSYLGFTNKEMEDQCLNHLPEDRERGYMESGFRATSGGSKSIVLSTKAFSSSWEDFPLEGSIGRDAGLQGEPENEKSLQSFFLGWERSRGFL